MTQTHRKIKDIVKNVPHALRLMCEGLEDANASENHEINMVTFGKVDNGICFACAATCATMKIGGKFYPLDNEVVEYCEDRADFMGFGFQDLNDFENSMDDARTGNLILLFLYFGASIFDARKWSIKYSRHFSIGTENWREQIPLVRKVADQMEAEMQAAAA